MIRRCAARPLSTQIDRTHDSVRPAPRVDAAPVTVLVVVYDTWLRWQLADALATSGCAVVQASNGASGLRLANRHRCDLILVAARLPELSGQCFVEAVRELPGTRHTPIMFVDQAERSPLTEASCELSLKHDDRLIITSSPPSECQAMPSVDALLRGDRSACVRRSRRTAFRAASGSSTPTVQKHSLPRSWCMPSRRDAADAPPASVPRPIEILLVDASPDDVRCTVEALREGRLRNNLSLARDGVEALQFLRCEGPFALAPRPDMLVLDLHLPGKQGQQVVAEIDADPLLQAIPMVVLTSSRTEQNGSGLSQAATSYVVNKPLDLEQFIRVVTSIEDFRLTVETPPAPARTNSGEVLGRVQRVARD